jgi:hypothetical protein
MMSSMREKRFKYATLEFSDFGKLMAVAQLVHPTAYGFVTEPEKEVTGKLAGCFAL